MYSWYMCKLQMQMYKLQVYKHDDGDFGHVGDPKFPVITFLIQTHTSGWKTHWLHIGLHRWPVHLAVWNFARSLSM